MTDNDDGTALDRIEIFKGRDGVWRYRGVARNNEVIFASEGYTRRQSAKETAERINPGVPVVDVIEP